MIPLLQLPRSAVVGWSFCRIPAMHHLPAVAFATMKKASRTRSSSLPPTDSIPANNQQLCSAIDINDELKNSFMSYAMSTILSRALPDARDGLKPVHRRILYAMYVLKLNPNSSFRKCARIVGEVLGKYHPHGDQSVYDALVRMTQSFAMAHPLISGHGNFGSIDNDPPAAMRYTEAKLTDISFETLLADLNLDTVHFETNFDGNDLEPVVFPARVPLLLLNGASGIAVGMSTNIPPHNLKELMTGIIALIKNPNLPTEELLRIIPGPDFPTGGIIINQSGARALHSQGQGSVTLRAKTELMSAESNVSIKSKKKKSAAASSSIVVTELPYTVVKSDLIMSIAQLVDNKRIEGIADIRDESDRNGLRIVIDCKKDTDPALVLRNLFAKSDLQTNINGSMIAITNQGKRPELLNLREALDAFIKFRFETITRRSTHLLRLKEARLHILQGISKMLDHSDKVMKLIQEAEDTASAKKALTLKPFSLSELQADEIMGLRLGRLTSLEVGKVKSEINEISASVDNLKGILSNEQKVYDIMVEETLSIIEKFGIPRRTSIEYDVSGVKKDKSPRKSAKPSTKKVKTKASRAISRPSLANKPPKLKKN